MLDMIHVCGMGMLSNIKEDVKVDECEWFGRNRNGIKRFSELKIINNLTFMLKELYIICEDDEILFNIRSGRANSYVIEIDARLFDRNVLLMYLTDIEDRVKDWDDRVRFVDTTINEKMLKLRIKENIK